MVTCGQVFGPFTYNGTNACVEGTPRLHLRENTEDPKQVQALEYGMAERSFQM